MAELWGEYGRNLLVAVIGVGLALICLVGILWIVRGRRGPSPFVRGGRNRQPRLQVLDAAAVDARRRLVLVRRDDVEHLIMIGGPTDVVIESRIIGPAGDAETPIQDAQTLTTAAPTVAIAAKPAATEPARRPAPIAAPAPRPEAIKEPMTEAPSREARAVAAPQPAAAPPIPAPRLEPAQSRPRAEPPAVTQPALDDAAQLLDSQRNRVFAEHNAAPAATVPVARPAPQPVTASTARPTGLGSDFEKILEEEMAHNMAARETSLANRPGRPLPQAGPAVAIPVVATPGAATREDPSLQSEVARIFGEMSASRDK